MTAGELHSELGTVSVFRCVVVFDPSRGWNLFKTMTRPYIKSVGIAGFIYDHNCSLRSMFRMAPALRDQSGECMRKSQYAQDTAQLSSISVVSTLIGESAGHTTEPQSLDWYDIIILKLSSAHYLS